MEVQSIPYRLVTMILRAALVGTLFVAGWLVYKQLPAEVGPGTAQPNGETKSAGSPAPVTRHGWSDARHPD
jgi:hypothetical protein